jgi:hypothetical protein
MDLEIDFVVKPYTRENIVNELQRIAAAVGKTSLSAQDINCHGRIGAQSVCRLFGSLRKGVQAAGLTPVKYTRATDQELCSIIIKLWRHTQEAFGRSPRRGELKTFECHVSPDTFTRRYGSWTKALQAAAEHMRTSPAGPKANGAGHATAAHPPAPPSPSGTASQRRKPLSLRKRFFVFKRDRYKCRICKRSGIELQVDHRVPVAQGGSDALDNLQTLCIECNRGKRHSSE